MPFFSSRKPEEEVHEEPAPLLPPTEKKHHHGMGLFGSNRSSSPSRASNSNNANGNRTSSVSSAHTRGASSISSVSSTSEHGGASRHRSVLSRFGGGGIGNGNAELDPSIQGARERVMSAEKAETEADRALAAARLRVREARDEVKRLELEAAEEARRAKIKQYHAREVSKRGKQLGRKFPPSTPPFSVVSYTHTPVVIVAMTAIC